LTVVQTCNRVFFLPNYVQGKETKLMLCCLFGHLPGKCEIIEVYEPSGMERVERGRMAYVQLKGWCYRCGVHYQWRERLSEWAIRALHWGNDELHKQMAKLEQDAHHARQEADTLRAQIAGGVNHLKTGTLEEQTAFERRYNDYFHKG
jgi:hypothetical protein